MWSVTITGADDFVDPETLVRLGETYPFVEWGILWSVSRSGTPRYPSRDWTMLLADLAQKHPCLRLSHHLCGHVAQDAMRGDCSSTLNVFHRVQINGFCVTKANQLMPEQQTPIILPVSSDFARERVRSFVLSNKTRPLQVLWDFSGGRGVPMSVLPSPEFVTIPCGFAGGIGPDNIHNVMRMLKDFPPTWIDMESNVRTGNVLDFDKVQRVLDVVGSA
jgi:hypothetical protein